MLVWLASYPRSGNHLLRAILHRCFDLESYEIYQNPARPADPAVSAMIGARAFPDASAKVLADRARTSEGLFLVKTHDLVPEADRCIYIVRDGRPALVSYQRYLADAENRVLSLSEVIEGKAWPGNWSEHVERFLGREPTKTLVLKYEDLVSDHPPLERIAAFLGVQVQRPFDLSFADFRKLNRAIFPVGSNGPGIEVMERACSGQFWRSHGATMRKLGYVKPLGAHADEVPRVFFFHLPKCAGTSVWGLLKQSLGADAVLQVSSPTLAQQFTAMDPGERDRYRAIGGHFALNAYRDRLDLSRYLSVTTFREPVERLASEYRYATSNPNHSHHRATAQLTFREFIERNTNPIAMLLCGRADAEAAANLVREVFDDWAFVDDLSRLVDTLCQHLGQPPRRLLHLNRGPTKSEAVSVNEDDRALIHRLHEADIELHRILRADRREIAAPRVIRRQSVEAANPPTFQVVTPTFNAESFLEEAIQSVVNQEGDFAIRYHIQDGGSSDQTVAIARNWSERIATGAFRPRCLSIVMTVDSRPDGGMYDAIAAGFRKLAPAPEDIATWVNGDDRLAAGAMRIVSEVLRDLPRVDLVGGRQALIDASGQERVSSDLQLYPRRCLTAGLHDGRDLPFVMQEGTFWRAALWNRVGGVDPTFRLAGDWDLWRRFAAETEYVTLDAVTAYHRRRPGQLSEDMPAYYREVDERIAGARVERDRVFREYRDMWRPNHYATVEAFPARVAQRSDAGRWVLCDWQLSMPRDRQLLPIDGDWIAASGFDPMEGPFPQIGIGRPIHWATESSAVLKVFSAHAGTRTFSLWLGGAVRGQRVGLRFNGGPIIRHKLRRRSPKMEVLALRLPFEIGPATIELLIDQFATTREGRKLGLMVGGATLTNEAPPKASWLRRRLPEALQLHR
jgi:hypothetical protein